MTGYRFISRVLFTRCGWPSWPKWRTLPTSPNLQPRDEVARLLASRTHENGTRPLALVPTCSPAALVYTGDVRGRRPADRRDAAARRRREDCADARQNHPRLGESHRAASNRVVCVISTSALFQRRQRALCGGRAQRVRLTFLLARTEQARRRLGAHPRSADTCPRDLTT